VGGIRQPGARERQAPGAGAAGQPSAASQMPQPGVRQPQAIGRQPLAVSRQPQGEPTQPVQSGIRSAYDGHDRGAFRAPLPETIRGRVPGQSDTTIYTNRPQIERPPTPGLAAPRATVPAAPPAPERPQYGFRARRPDSVVTPIVPPTAQQSQPGATPSQGRSAVAPRYERQAAPSPPPAAAPPPPQRQEQASPPPRERDGGQARPRGHEAQQSSSSPPPEQQQQGQGGGHGSRRPR
jgi:hypothetical protein